MRISSDSGKRRDERKRELQPRDKQDTYRTKIIITQKHVKVCGPEPIHAHRLRIYVFNLVKSDIRENIGSHSNSGKFLPFKHLTRKEIKRNQSCTKPYETRFNDPTTPYHRYHFEQSASHFVGDIKGEEKGNKFSHFTMSMSMLNSRWSICQTSCV